MEGNCTHSQESFAEWKEIHTPGIFLEELINAADGRMLAGLTKEEFSWGHGSPQSPPHSCLPLGSRCLLQYISG